MRARLLHVVVLACALALGVAVVCSARGSFAAVVVREQRPVLTGYLAFNSWDSPDGLPRIFVMRADGQGYRQLPRSHVHLHFTGVSDTDPAWSKDGRFIAFTSDRAPLPRGNSDIYVMDVATGVIRDISGDKLEDEGAAWSRDGRRLAFARTTECKSKNNVVHVPCRGGALMVVNADGSGLRPLLTTWSSNLSPSWSPDGKQIAFSEPADGTIFSDILVMNANGGKVRNLTRTPMGDEFSPAWSPDGKRIAYACGFAGAGVCVMDANGSHRRRLTPANVTSLDTHPAWSPDGHWIAFTADGNTNSHNDGIWAVSADGKRLQQIRALDAPTASVDWVASTPLRP
jgi:TolB protein